MGKNHTHKYKRVDIGKDSPHWVMKCIEDNCSHYVHMKSKLSCPMLRGNIAKCNRCGERFELNRRALRMEFPCCENCVKRKNKTELEKAADFFKDLEESLVEK